MSASFDQWEARTKRVAVACIGSAQAANRIQGMKLNALLNPPTAAKGTFPHFRGGQ